MIHIRLIYNNNLPRMGSGMYMDDYMVEVRDGVSCTTEQMPLREFLYRTGPFPNQREIEMHVIKILQSGDPREIERLCIEIDSRYRTAMYRRQPTVNYVPIEVHNVESQVAQAIIAKEECISSRDRDIYYLLTS